VGDDPDIAKVLQVHDERDENGELKVESETLGGLCSRVLTETVSVFQNGHPDTEAKPHPFPFSKAAIL
jgi:hypothetical protein